MDERIKGKRIMVVDDESDLTLFYRMSLEYHGVEVETFNHPRKALSNFKPDYYDLLLIDIKMPNIDGFELYEKIREIDNKVKVWFITAYETYHKALKDVLSTSKGETSPGPVIGKPIEIDKLVKQIRTELD